MGRTSLILNYHSFAKTDFFGSLSKGGKSAKKVGLPVGKPVVNLKFGTYFEFSVPLQSLIKRLLSLIMALIKKKLIDKKAYGKYVSTLSALERILFDRSALSRQQSVTGFIWTALSDLNNPATSWTLQTCFCLDSPTLCLPGPRNRH